MRTCPQYLEKGAHCERLARNCGSPLNQRALLEAAAHWRILARLAAPSASVAVDSAAAKSRLDDQALAKLLSEAGELIR